MAPAIYLLKANKLNGYFMRTSLATQLIFGRYGQSSGFASLPICRAENPLVSASLTLGIALEQSSTEISGTCDSVTAPPLMAKIMVPHSLPTRHNLKREGL